MRLQGQTEAGVILQLDDNLSDFQDAADPRFLIYPIGHWMPRVSTENGRQRRPSRAKASASRRTGTFIRDMTIDLGEDNPGAIGINVHDAQPRRRSGG